MNIHPFNITAALVFAGQEKHTFQTGLSLGKVVTTFFITGLHSRLLFQQHLKLPPNTSRLTQRFDAHILTGRVVLVGPGS